MVHFNPFWKSVTFAPPAAVAGGSGHAVRRSRVVPFLGVGAAASGGGGGGPAPWAPPSGAHVTPTTAASSEHRLLGLLPPLRALHAGVGRPQLRGTGGGGGGRSGTA